MIGTLPLNVEVECVRCGGTYITAADGENTNRDACPRYECMEARKAEIKESELKKIKLGKEQIVTAVQEYMKKHHDENAIAVQFTIDLDDKQDPGMGEISATVQVD